MYVKRSATFCFCLCFLLIPFSVVHAGGAAILDLLPENDDISGWLRDGDPILATDMDSLAMLINGAAPFYLERGVVEALFQDYINHDDLFLTLEIYRMPTQEQARQLYADIEADKPEQLEQIGNEARLMSGVIDAYLLEFWQKTFFIRLTIDEKSAYSKEVIVNFANHVSGQISQP